MSREILTKITPQVYQAALRASTGAIDCPQTSNMSPSTNIGILATPSTPWAKRVDEIEAPFASVYDEEEYKRNPALALMGLYELRLMLKSLGVISIQQTDYRSRPLEGKQLLVVGTGPGREVLALAGLGAQVVGFDATKQYVEIAEEKVIKWSLALGQPISVTLYQCPAEEFPYELDYYDGVTSLFGVLNHINLWQETLQKISQGLRPGGRLILSMYGPNDALVFRLLGEGKLSYKPSILQRRTEGGILLGDSDEVLPANFPAVEEISQTLIKNGLTIKETRGFLRIAALFPQNSSPVNLREYLKLIEQIDPRAAILLKKCQTDEILLTAFLYDQTTQAKFDINQSAYIFFVAEKPSKEA